MTTTLQVANTNLDQSSTKVVLENGCLFGAKCDDTGKVGAGRPTNTLVTGRIHKDWGTALYTVRGVGSGSRDVDA